MKAKFQETVNAVERILKADSTTRDSDRALIIEFMLEHTCVGQLPEKVQRKIEKAIWTQMPSFETITRCRRKIQNDWGMYQASNKTQTARKAKQRAMKAMMR